MCTMARALVLGALVCAAAAARAECFAPHRFTGEVVPVQEITAVAGLFHASASYAANGDPTITYSPAFRKDPPALQQFIRMRECAHLFLRTPDELLANCFALVQVRRDGLPPQGEALIAQFELSGGSLRDGRSSLSFWAKTLACANGPNPF